MSKLHPKSRLHSFFHSKLVLLVLIIIMVFLLQSVYERFQVEQDMAARRAAVEAELRELEVRKATLEEEVEYLSHERGIEAEMRRQFDVALPGEEVVIIVDERSEETGEEEKRATSTPSSRPWYKFW